MGALAFGASGAAAQRQGAGGNPPPCAPVPAARGATIRAGNEGGSLRPRVVAIDADGTIRVGRAAPGDSIGSIPTAAVGALASLARKGGFWDLNPPRIRQPSRNPDAARSYIEVTLTCGFHRVEYVMGEPMPAAFTEFGALLAFVVDGPPRR